MAPARPPPFWTCPKCRKKLAGRNTWHSCGPRTIEGFLETRGPRARVMYQALERELRRIGPVLVSPSKTSIAFMVRVRFAGIVSLSERGMTLSFGLRRPVEHPCIRRVEHPVPSWFVHYVRIQDPAELDTTVRGWLREAYELGEHGNPPRAAT